MKWFFLEASVDLVIMFPISSPRSWRHPVQMAGWKIDKGSPSPAVRPLTVWRVWPGKPKTSVRTISVLFIPRTGHFLTRQSYTPSGKRHTTVKAEIKSRYIDFVSLSPPCPSEGSSPQAHTHGLPGMDPFNYLHLFRLLGNAACSEATEKSDAVFN